MIALYPRRPRLVASHPCPRSRYKITVSLGTGIKGVKATDAAEPKNTSKAGQERSTREESQVRLLRDYARISRAYLEWRCSKGFADKPRVDLAVALPAPRSSRKKALSSPARYICARGSLRTTLRCKRARAFIAYLYANDRVRESAWYGRVCVTLGDRSPRDA